MTERSRSPPPSKAAEEQSQATIQSVQDTMTNMFETMMKKFEQMEGTQTIMNNGIGAMGIKIGDMEQART